MGSIPSQLPEQSTSDSETMTSFLSALPSQHLEPLWTQMSALVPSSPNPIAKPHLWRFSDVQPHLLLAGSLVPAAQAERRVLMLVNPSLSAPFTTDTLYGGLQLVAPGETAPAHRHVAFAARFIIDGEGFTAVEGRKMALRRGDVVVTPSWHWHDHGNESQEPVLWLDALNLPLFTYARVHFAEGYAESRYPSRPVEKCEWKHPWDPVQRALEEQNKNHAVYAYKKADGGMLSTTVGAQAERIAPGYTTEVMQEQSSFMYHCYDGKGNTIVEPPGGEKTVFEWTARDTFAVPAWSKVQHVNVSEEEPAYLVAFHDRPFLELLGLVRPGGS